MMKDRVNTTMNRLDRAFGLLSKIFVHEDDVERMAYAKRELQAAFGELDALKKALAAQQKTQQEDQQEGEQDV